MKFYIFEQENYISNLSAPLREDMKSKFIDTGKVKLIERRTGYIRFGFTRHRPKVSTIEPQNQVFGFIGGKSAWPELLHRPVAEAKIVISREVSNIAICALKISVLYVFEPYVT